MIFYVYNFAVPLASN